MQKNCAKLLNTPQCRRKPYSDARNAEGLIASGQAGMVAIVRVQITNPFWADKAVTGSADDIRTYLQAQFYRLY